MNLNKIMTEQERKKDEYIKVFNKEYKYIKEIKNICYNSDMEINDYEYNILSSALDYIQEELNEGKQLDNIDCYYFIDREIPVYTCDLLKWLHDIGTEYTDKAIEEYGEFNTTTDLLMKGYSFHAEKMFHIAMEIAEHIENKTNK